jgi:hypothetical protein
MTPEAWTIAVFIIPRQDVHVYPVLESDDAGELNNRGLGRRVGDIGHSKPADARDGTSSIRLVHLPANSYISATY